ncbi:unnamed protein product [Notodromas monacha]|uniref:Uncharacterized protein n=1 Tax=Notodromas monacha TaxID=399045 RepID=A0A7R9BN10_9CRUS|nr:unnamed protein product [Notodromas monacha]CAG0917003.1 unnamed protein product [Notodromas monacha]
MVRGKEIISLQLGKSANEAGVAWFNSLLQRRQKDEAGDEKDPWDEDKILLRESKDFGKLPRAVMVDLKENIGYPPRIEKTSDSDQNEPMSHWTGAVTVHASEPDVIGSGWAKDALFPLPEKSLIQVEGFPEDFQNSFEKGVDVWESEQFKDALEDSLRFLAEECESLDGIQVTVDMTTGLAGLTCPVTNFLRDEFGPGKTIPVFLLHTPCDPKDVFGAVNARLTAALTMAGILETSSGVIPFCNSSSPNNNAHFLETLLSPDRCRLGEPVTLGDALVQCKTRVGPLVAPCFRLPGKISGSSMFGELLVEAVEDTALPDVFGNIHCEGQVMMRNSYLVTLGLGAAPFADPDEWLRGLLGVPAQGDARLLMLQKPLLVSAAFPAEGVMQAFAVPSSSGLKATSSIAGLVQGGPVCKYVNAAADYCGKVTKHGRGRQHWRIGLGLKSLVMAQEVMHSSDAALHLQQQLLQQRHQKVLLNVDPETEPLSRVRFVPLRLLHISVYSKRQSTLRVKFPIPVRRCNRPGGAAGVLMELADRDRQNKWRCWKEKIELLNDKDIYATTSMSTCSSEMFFNKQCCKDENALETCGQNSSANCTYFVNQGYPGTVTTPGSCQLAINKCGPDICQIRLDFLQFQIGGPSNDQTNSPNTVGQCLNDQFLVTASGGTSSPVICGKNTGQHMYLDVSNLNQATVLTVVTSSLTASLTSRAWKIKITQIKCESSWAATSGCLQYFTGISGRFYTFNYDNAQGQQLANQDYSFCIRMEAGFCGIRYTQCTDNANTPSQSFSVTGNSAAGAGLSSQISDACATQQDKDWVTIPCGTTTCFFIVEIHGEKAFKLFLEPIKSSGKWPPGLRAASCRGEKRIDREDPCQMSVRL